MKEAKRLTCGIVTTVVLGWMAAMTGPVPAQDKKPDAEEAVKIAVEAYIYGYPLVTMEMTRRVICNAAEPKGTHGPMGQFVNLREYPTPTFKEVTAPNTDTVYSSAWLALPKGPALAPWSSWVQGGCLLPQA